MNFIYFIINLIIFVNGCLLVSSTISKSDKKQKKKQEKNPIDLSSLDLYDKVKVDYKNIVQKSLHQDPLLVDKKQFVGANLAYVTPWNGYGYDVARNNTAKFSHVSPVWLQLRYDGATFEIGGQHDIDLGWMMALRAANHRVKIVPRLLMEHWTVDMFQHVVNNEYLIAQVITLIKTTVLKYNFDGIVLEMWLQLGMRSRPETIHFLTHLSSQLHASNLQLILVVPPPLNAGNQPGYFSRDDYHQLVTLVDFLSLMTYDFSNQRAGPNAPLEWMLHCVQLLIEVRKMAIPSHILLGLNFYGYSYSQDGIKPILRHEFIKELEDAMKVDVVWHQDVKEHEFLITDRSGTGKSVWYPTKESVDVRLKLATQLGVGISIWEIGQGLDYFYDVI